MADRARKVFDTLAHKSGLSGLLERRSRRGFIVLMYHRVLPDELCAEYSLANLVVPRSVFQEQAAWLVRHFHVQTVGEAIQHTQQHGDRPRLCITFDDGYWDNASIAAPILESAGLRATFYLSTDFLYCRKGLWFDRAATAWQMDQPLVRRVAMRVFNREPTGLRDWLDALMYDAALRHAALAMIQSQATHDLDTDLNRAMTVEDAKGLAGCGHELGAHSKSHPILTHLDDAALSEEIAGSLQLVADWAGRAEIGFAYPNGSFDSRVRMAVELSGASHACSTLRGAHLPDADVFAIRRRAIFPDSVTLKGVHHTAALRSEISGLHDWQRGILRALRRTTGKRI